MNKIAKLVGTTIVALVIVLGASPAHARPLSGPDGQVPPRKACARIIVTAHGDCIVHHVVNFSQLATMVVLDLERQSRAARHHHHRAHRAHYRVNYLMAEQWLPPIVR